MVRTPAVWRAYVSGLLDVNPALLRFAQHQGGGAVSRQAARRDRQPADESLFSVMRSVSRWATTGISSRPGERAKYPGGCLNPVVLVKIVVFLLLIALMPLFMLPMILVRIVMFGPNALRFNSTIDVTAGDAARWGRGVLEPAQDAPQVRVALAAIASRDPGFQTARLTAWASAATALMCQSLTSGDPAPARTFMANGLFRTHSALLELRSRGSVSCEGSWVAAEARVVDAISTPLFDEVRVRLRCEGFCWERHGVTGLTLRGGPDRRAWSEDLTFGRSSGATTPPAGGLPAKHCPSCGAPLDLDQDGSCRYCNGIVTAGRHDWVLTGWRREPW
jgi:hypothetical protein